MTRRRSYCDCHGKQLGDNDFEYFDGSVSWFCPITKEPCEIEVRDL